VIRRIRALGALCEWVADWYLPYPGSQYENEDFGHTYKVVRGGSWDLQPYYVRTAQRNYDWKPDIRNDRFGFRCVVPSGE